MGDSLPLRDVHGLVFPLIVLTLIKSFGILQTKT